MARRMWTRQEGRQTQIRENPQPEPIGEVDLSVYMNLKGYKDDDAGTYTGTPGELITNPADVIHHLLRVYGGEAANKICLSGFGNFTAARSALNGAVSPFNFTIRLRQAEQKWVHDVIEHICEQTTLNYIPPIDGLHKLVAWVAAENLGASYLYRPVADGGLVKFSWKEHIVPGSVSFHYTPQSQIYNEVYVNYDYDYKIGSFKKLAYVDPHKSEPQCIWEENQCALSQDRYAIKRRLTINADLLYREGEAEHLRYFTVYRFAHPKLIVNFDTKINASDMLPRQAFEFDSDLDVYLSFPIKDSDGSWADKKFFAQRISRMHNPKSQIGYRIEAIYAGSD